MCLNCGCGRPDDQHGSDANIVVDDLRRAGEVNDQDLATTIGNLRDSLSTVSQRASTHGERAPGASE